MPQVMLDMKAVRGKWPSTALLFLWIWLTAGKVAGADTNWMAGIPGERRLSQISIPGTHDTAARYETWPDTTICQHATIPEQLNFGIRLLDIRCRHIHDAFDIYHGSVSQKLTFSNVLQEVTAFLKSNPTECVLMSVKEEYKPEDNTRSFDDTFRSYVAADPEVWWLGSSVPALDAVRGKIVLIRRFDSARDEGINASDWPDNRVFSDNHISVEDWYEVTNNAVKWMDISNALVNASADANADTLHLTFASGYQPHFAGIPSISSVSKYMNPRLVSFFSAAPRGHYGCVLMDFADADRARLVYGSNFKDGMGQ